MSTGSRLQCLHHGHEGAPQFLAAIDSITNSTLNEAADLGPSRPTKRLARWPTRNEINFQRLQAVDKDAHLSLVRHVDVERLSAEIRTVGVKGRLVVVDRRHYGPPGRLYPCTEAARA
ncbi:hypothetical protein GCM10025876_37590 [Demequina litorisediminis]|uniref:Uncharacterized protein n=1 Tax=Demequina litorisediminis TaxID=1849022 RepID=A0ABQ6II44_9MICO|nr:hypothetical protein [Demequina litorisediminis]GMA37555.1 hypothetical protein GCM10025876_37590 [Demequina litorisediminis]